MPCLSSSRRERRGALRVLRGRAGPTPGAIAELPGRFARAAVFAGATLASACGAPQPAPGARVTEAPPVDAAASPLVLAPPVDAGAPVVVPVNAGAPVVPPVDAGVQVTPPPAPVVPAVGVIDGVLRSTGPGRPGAGGVVIRLAGPGAPQVVVTDAAGRFQFAGLVPGTWTVAYDDWWSPARNPANPSTTVERRIKIGASKRPVAILFTFKGAPPAMPVRAHQAMPYGAPPARRRVV